MERELLKHVLFVWSCVCFFLPAYVAASQMYSVGEVSAENGTQTVVTC